MFFGRFQPPERIIGMIIAEKKATSLRAHGEKMLRWKSLRLLRRSETKRLASKIEIVDKEEREGERTGEEIKEEGGSLKREAGD